MNNAPYWLTFWLLGCLPPFSCFGEEDERFVELDRILRESTIDRIEFCGLPLREALIETQKQSQAFANLEFDFEQLSVDLLEEPVSFSLDRGALGDVIHHFVSEFRLECYLVPDGLQFRPRSHARIALEVGDHRSLWEPLPTPRSAVKNQIGQIHIVASYCYSNQPFSLKRKTPVGEEDFISLPEVANPKLTVVSFGSDEILRKSLGEMLPPVEEIAFSVVNAQPEIPLHFSKNEVSFDLSVQWESTGISTIVELCFDWPGLEPFQKKLRDGGLLVASREMEKGNFLNLFIIPMVIESIDSWP